VISKNLKKRGPLIFILALAPQNSRVMIYRQKLEGCGLNVDVHLLRLCSSCARFLLHKSLCTLTAFFDEQLEVCRKS